MELLVFLAIFFALALMLALTRHRENARQQTTARFRCHRCGLIAVSLAEAEDVAATCCDRDCGMGQGRR